MNTRLWHLAIRLSGSLRRMGPAWAALIVTAALAPEATAAQTRPSPGFLASEIDRLSTQIESEVISWRRDIHQHPELGNREFRTAALVADHLRSLGLVVETEVAHTGVVALLQGGMPGPVVAVRADMDALPVTEALDLPFASTVTTEYNGREVGVMHACGHDNHVAILMGVARVLSELSDRIPGTVKFIFQPAEEGAPAGEEGGADLMIREGVLNDPAPEAIFGLHVFPGDVGTIRYWTGGALASADGLRIAVRGRQTHGAQPWNGVDPIVVASQIVLGLQTIVSRQVDLTASPSVVTIGSIHGGVRGNIIPDEVELVGTIRTFDRSVQLELHRRIRETASSIAKASGATAEIDIRVGVPVTVNDPDLTATMVPTLQRVAGSDGLSLSPPLTGAEDFAFFAERIPGVYISLGVTPRGADMDTVPVNHSPRFFADEGALIVGVRALANMAVDYLAGAPPYRD